MTIMIGSPAYNGQVTTQYMHSLLRLKDAGITFEVPEYSDSLVTRARNSLVARFLNDTRYSHLFWVDCDVGFSVEQFCRLIAKDQPITAAAYPFKYMNWTGEPVKQQEALLSYVVNLRPEDNGRAEPDADGFIQVHDAATGFMCIRRDALELMVQKYPELAYKNDVPNGPQENMYLFFDTMVEDGRYLSEDYAFCRRWQRIGGSIYLDATSKLTHTGPYTFNGDLQLTGALKNEPAPRKKKGA